MIADLSTGSGVKEDPELFQSTDARDIPLAVAICKACPVLAICREDVLAREGGDALRWGVVAGLTPAQRRGLRPRAALKGRAA